MSEDALYTALGVSAWVAGIIAPPAVAVVCWVLARRVRASWVVHALLVPVLLLIEWLLADALFFAAHDNGDGPPGLGVALIPSVALAFVSVCAYFCALLGKWIAGLRRRA